MYYQKLKSGRFSFVYYDQKLKKNVRLKKSKTLHITTEEEAAQFCKAWQANHNASLERHERLTSWKNQFHNFDKLIHDFTLEKQEEAPNSFQSYVQFFENYVLAFFLGELKLNNPASWPHKFEQFRTWLLSVKKIRKGKTEKLSYASRNHCIKSLNAFLTMLERRGLIESFQKCRYFPDSKLTRRDESSVIPAETQILILNELNKIDPLSADLFLTALHTGMRLNELLGLSLADFFHGELDNEFLKNALAPHHLKPIAFIQLESQPKNSLHIRSTNGKVERKPLKGKHKIDPEYSRTIPIFDRHAFEVLAKLWNYQLGLYNQRTHGKDPKNYLLFDGLNKNTYSNHLRAAQKNLKLPKYFVPHDCRHSYSTWLVTVSGGNYALAKLILGHGSIDVTERYVHIGQSLQRKLKASQQLEKPIELSPQKPAKLHLCPHRENPSILCNLCA